MAAVTLGYIYRWGQGVAVDYKRAMVGYKIGAEVGDAICQYQLGLMLSEEGYGVNPPDYKQALVWFGKAAAQDHPRAFGRLAYMAREGHGQPPSWARARELWQRSSTLGEDATEFLDGIKASICMVTQRADAAPYTTGCPSLIPTAPQFAPLMDQRVEVYGTSRQDMNGKRGVATDFQFVLPTAGLDYSQSRYTVRFDSGESYKIKIGNVRAEPAGAVSGARPKAKKGRGKRRGV